MPVAAAVDLLGSLGVDEPSARTSIFRLKKRGWLEPESRHGVKGYRLTDLALDALAAGDAKVWHAPGPAALADGWCVVTFSVPESARAVRHQLRTKLSYAGFGNIGAGVWIAPARAADSARALIDELGVADQCAVFAGGYIAGQDITRLVRQGWDLDALAQRYRAFVADAASRADAAGSARAGETAFVDYVSTVDLWRPIAALDPGLPSELLGGDWPAAEAGELFEGLVRMLEPEALRHAAASWPAPATSAA